MHRSWQITSQLHCFANTPYTPTISIRYFRIYDHVNSTQLYTLRRYAASPRRYERNRLLYTCGCLVARETAAKHVIWHFF